MKGTSCRGESAPGIIGPVHNQATQSLLIQKWDTYPLALVKSETGLQNDEEG